MKADELAILDRIATAQEAIALAMARLAAHHGAAVEVTPVSAPKPVTARTTFTVEDIAADEVEKPVLTMAEIKVVTAVFKEVNQIELAKEALAEAGANNVSELSTREAQEKFLVFLKGKAKLIAEPQRSTAITAINTLLGV